MKLSVPFTRHPDFLVDDDILPSLDSIEVRALWVLMRFSLGFDRLTTGPLSVATLGLKAGLSYRSAQRALSLLEERGYIRRHLHPGQVSSYELTLPGVRLVPEESGLSKSRRRCGGGAWEGMGGHVGDGVAHDLERKGQRESSWREGQEDSVPALQEAKEGLADPETSEPVPTGETGELQEIAEAVVRKLEGVSLRLVNTADVLPTLRALKAESLNQGLRIDLRALVLEKVEHGIAANRRKNGGESSIHGWSYFVKGLPEALEAKRRDAARHAEIRKVREVQAQDESARERLEESRTNTLRGQWESLKPDVRAEVEATVQGQLPGFLLQLIRRDREQGKRGSGIAALEHACLQELESRNLRGWLPGRPGQVGTESAG